MSIRAERSSIEREIRAMSRYNHHAWMRRNIVKADKRGWNWIVLSCGDVRDKMDLGFSNVTAHRTRFVEIDGVPHTVIEVRDRFLPILERAKGLREFYSMMCHMISAADIKRFFYDLWVAGNNIEAKARRATELTTGEPRRMTATEREVSSVFSEGLRAAARHYGTL